MLFVIVLSLVFNSTGTWYQMDGQGEAISVSACSPSTNVSTHIMIYSGSCEDLLCMTEGVPNVNCQERPARRTIFLAEEDKTYFILLLSSVKYNGDIKLTVTEFEGIENDFCQAASSVAIDCGEIEGTTVGAYMGSQRNDCYNDLYPPDVWFFVDGTGDVLQATACSSKVTLFSIFILEGNCTDSICIGNASSETESCATVQFQSVLEETYYIIFKASNESDTGTFFLSVNTTSAEARRNNLCSNTELINPIRNTTNYGSTTDAIQDSDKEDAVVGEFIGWDLWYQIVGNGVGILVLLFFPF
jgi:hypothetical protein